MKRIVCGKGGWLKDAANYGMDFFMGINKGALGTVTGGATNQFFDQAHEKMYKNEDENYQRKHNSVYGYSQAGGAAITGIVSENPSAMTGVISGLSMGISNTGARNMENASVYKKGGIVKYKEGGGIEGESENPFINTEQYYKNYFNSESFKNKIPDFKPNFPTLEKRYDNTGTRKINFNLGTSEIPDWSERNVKYPDLEIPNAFKVGKKQDGSTFQAIEYYKNKFNNQTNPVLSPNKGTKLNYKLFEPVGEKQKENTIDTEGVLNHEYSHYLFENNKKLKDYNLNLIKKYYNNTYNPEYHNPEYKTDITGEEIISDWYGFRKQLQNDKAFDFTKEKMTPDVWKKLKEKYKNDELYNRLDGVRDNMFLNEKEDTDSKFSNFVNEIASNVSNNTSNINMMKSGGVVYKKGGIVKYQEGGSVKKVNPYAPTPVNWSNNKTTNLQDLINQQLVPAKRDATNTRNYAKETIDTDKNVPHTRDDTKLAPKGSIRSGAQKIVNAMHHAGDPKIKADGTTVYQNTPFDPVIKHLVAPVFQSGINIANTIMGDRPIRNDDDIANFGMDALMVTPVINGGVNLAKKYLPNTYKLNPWAFKPNPESYYRMVGEKGIEDAIEKAVITTPKDSYRWDSKVFDKPYFHKGHPIDGRNYKGATSYGNYGGPGMVEVSKDFPMEQMGKATRNNFVPKETDVIPLKDAKLYEQHWLKGYKEVPKPKSNFKSEIDWSNYLTQKQAVTARAERMLSQENKWVGQNNQELKIKFDNAQKNHNPASDYPGERLGTNKGNTTEVSKDALLSEPNKARIAAHETGHYYRNRATEANEWNSFFDFSKLEKHKTRTYLRGKPTAVEPGYVNSLPETQGFKIGKDGVPHGDEIRERAAQLKDYIAQKNGIPLNKDFQISSDQLDDAIKNYVKDTGLDNSMSVMLSSLVDKKGFLKAMNKYALAVPAAIGAAALQQNETPKYAKGGIVRYGEGGKVGEKEKLINAYQLEQAKINANYESVKKYRNQIDKIVQEALSNPDQFDQSFKKNVDGRLEKAGVPEHLRRQCIYTVSIMVNSARSNAGLPLLKGASFQQDGSLGKPMVSNVYTQNEAFKANAVNEGFHITPQGTLPKKGDWIQQGRTFKAKNGTMQQNPFHSVLALDPIINDKGDTLGINSIYNGGHGTIINTGLPKDRFKDEFRVYSYQGENINNTVNTRDSLKNEINKIDPAYFNSKQTPFYNDYNPTSLPINKDLDNDKKTYLESLNANKQEIMKHWNISNSEFDKLADIAFRIPSQESEWGKGIAYNVKGVLPELVQGVKYLKGEDSSEKNVSRGIGSVKIKKILDDPKIKEFFDNLNLTGDQLYNNAYIASNENFPIKTGALLTMTKLVNDYRHTLNDKNFPRNSEERYKESIYKYKGIKHENKTNDYVSSINNSEGIFKGKALNNIEDRKAEGNTTEISPGYNMQWSNENSKAYREKSEIPVTTNNTNTIVSPILPIEQPIKNPYAMNPVKFKRGGNVNKVQINVEGNELRVDPTNLSVITDYKGLPKHPDNPNFINPQGNVTANEGDVIVPKDMRDRFLNSDYKTKQRMITTLKYRIPETKFGDGGIITDHDKAYDYQRLSNGSWQARKKGSNKWGILKDNQLGDLNTRYPQSNGVPSTLPRVDNGIYSFPDVPTSGVPLANAGNNTVYNKPPGFFGNMPSYNPNVFQNSTKSGMGDQPDSSGVDKPFDDRIPQNKNTFEPMNTKGYQAAAIGSGIASAYSGIDYLLKHRSPYKTTFNRATANHLDPTEAIKGVNSAYGSVNYGLRNLGTAGYLSNRIESGSRQAGDIAKTRMEYDNANAQIDNNFSQFNTQISNSEIEANERNRDTYEMGRKQAMDQIAGAASGATKDAFMYKQEGRKVDYMNQMGLYKVNKKGQIVLRTEED